VPAFSWYCPNFDGTTSDLIVPLVSQVYGTAHNRVVPDLHHLQINRAKQVGSAISAEILYDQPDNEDINDFDVAFPAGQAWPLNCQ